MNTFKLLIIGKGGAKEGMGHLVRISTLVEAFAPKYDVNVLVKQDRFGEFFFKQKGISCFTYRDNRGLYRFLEKTGKNEKYRAIIIDIYRISISVIKKIENYCDLLVNFDDMQRRVQHRVKGAFLCPQEPFNREITSGDTTTVIKGTDYFPLRRVFTQYREKKQFRKDVKEIGIILGGVPSKAHTLELTRVMDGFLDKNIYLHVVMGFEPEEIDLEMFSSRVHMVKNVDNMAEFITEIDLGIIAGGFIKFEMMCIGTPFLLVSLCHHQQRLARKFAARGYGVYLGEIKDLIANQKKIRRKIESFILNETLRKKMFGNSRQLVDGKGSSRILALVNRLIGNIQSSNADC
jgi:spore coat polysaccharide biosynthesis predicted glycosyltransferase SpsG